MSRRLRIVLLISLLNATSFRAAAQWVAHTINLEAGWNAVYLEVEPYPAQCDLQFQGLPINSVWSYDPRFAGPEFVQDPAELSVDNPAWRFYFPPDHPSAFATNLFILGAGKAYLISAAQNTVWNVVGRPVVTQQRWKPDGYNLTGFSVDAANPPTLASWFAGSSAHNPLEVWALGASDEWERIFSPSSTTLEAGRAYWVYCQGQSDFQGPTEVRLTEGNDLDYGRLLVEHDVTFHVVGSATRTVTVSVMPSEPVPDPSLPALLGDVPLAYYRSTVQGGTAEFAYEPLPAGLTARADDAEGTLLRIAVERAKMTAAVGDGLYQSVLEIKDDAGMRRLIGVRSRARGPRVAAGAAKQATPEANPAAGLWVGSVNLDKVSERDREPDVLTETPTEFSFRVILHVDSSGTVRLLNEATQLWRNGTFKPDPTDPSVQIVDQPGYYLLLTPTAPQSLIDEIGTTVVPGTLRDGRPFARRIGTAAYALRDSEGNPEEPVMSLTGEFGVGASELRITLLMDDSNPMNPFHHQYHPKHKFPEPDATPVPSNDYTITRNMTFTFLSDPPDGLVLPGWGDIHVGGTFEEEVTGLTKNPIKARGVFRLQRASTVAVLNDGLGS
jgi:hypothetical protein